jgi:hypothetical protein
MQKYLYLTLLILSLSSVFAQNKKQTNSLIFSDLVVSEVIAIDTNYFNGYSYAKEFYSQSIKRAELTNKFKFSALLVNKMTDLGFTVYEDYSPYGNAYFERYAELFVKANISQILDNLGGRSDTIMLNNEKGELAESVVNQPVDTASLKALLFFDKWIFDKDDFQLTKTVLGFCPIRRYERDYDDLRQWLYRKTAWFVFPELKRRKQKRVEKRMEFLGHFEYEFSIENKLLFNKDDENALYLEELDAPNWNSYARQQFRNSLINRALSGKSKVVDFKTKEPLNQQQAKAKLGYEVVEMVLVDPETAEEKTIMTETGIYKEDIKSVIFFEDWYIDLETMRIKKVVKAIAPVRFYIYDGVIPKKEVAFIIYMN